MSKAADRLRALGRRDDHAAPLDIARAALDFAALAQPSEPLDPYESHLQDMVTGMVLAAAGRDADTAPERAAVLASVMASTFGYMGDAETYDDPRNANLFEVITRRRGLPVALGILYIHAARGAGWQAEGLRFPGHFLIRMEDPHGGRAVIDPFHGGVTVDAPAMRGLLKTVAGQGAELLPDHHAPVSDEEILIRLQNNIKTRALDRRDIHTARQIVQGLLLLAPHQAALWREDGVLAVREGDLPGAVEAMTAYQNRITDAAEIARVDRILDDLRRQMLGDQAS